MFRRKVKEDPTELQLLKIRVQNIEKEIAEMKRAPQVQAEEQGTSPIIELSTCNEVGVEDENGDYFQLVIRFKPVYEYPTT